MNFQDDPRSFAMELVETGLVSADHLLLCALKVMSNDDVREMLDCNELSPRFDDDDDDDHDDDDHDDDHDDEELYDIESESEFREWFWDNHAELSHLRDDNKSQNDYPANVREAFIEWLDYAVKGGMISPELAQDITL